MDQNYYASCLRPMQSLIQCWLLQNAIHWIDTRIDNRHCPLQVFNTTLTSPKRKAGVEIWSRDLASYEAVTQNYHQLQWRLENWLKYIRSPSDSNRRCLNRPTCYISRKHWKHLLHLSKLEKLRSSRILSAFKVCLNFASLKSLQSYQTNKLRVVTLIHGRVSTLIVKKGESLNGHVSIAAKT